MRFKKAGLAEILGFVMMFTMFAAFMVAFVFNNSVQERRGTLVDKLNTEAMLIQSKLEGYSEYSNNCFMYENGERISQSRARTIKNNAVDVAKQNIQNAFDTARFKSVFVLEDINIVINDAQGVKSQAEVKIDVVYTANVKMPFADNDEGKMSSDTIKGIRMTDSAKRTIENPIRLKNTKGV